MAHPSFPWQDEAISICLHKPKVYIDLSGWSPKYFSPTLIQYANSLLKTKMLFGSDYPLLTPDRWLADFAKIGIKDEVRPLILKGKRHAPLRPLNFPSLPLLLQGRRGARTRACHVGILADAWRALCPSTLSTLT